MDADAVKNVTEGSKRVNPVQPATRNQTVDHSGPLGTSVTPCEEPVLATNGNRPKNAFSQIVVDVKVTIVSPQSFLRHTVIGRTLFYQLYASGRLGPLPVRLGERSLWARAELEDWAMAGCPAREQWLRQKRAP